MFGFLYFVHTLVYSTTVRSTLLASLGSCHCNSEQDLRTALAPYMRTHLRRHSTRGETRDKLEKKQAGRAVYCTYCSNKK